MRLGDGVRVPVDVADIRLRLTDRIAVRLPGITRALAPRLIAAPAGSRLRIALMSRVLTAGWAACDSKDWAFLERLYAPDVVWHAAPDFLPDVSEPVVGRSAVFGFLDETWETMGWSDCAPAEIIDPGGPFMAACVQVRATGRVSGIAMNRDTVQLYEMTPDGVVGRQWSSNTFEEAAAFLDERLEERAQDPSSDRQVR